MFGIYGILQFFSSVRQLTRSYIYWKAQGQPLYGSELVIGSCLIPLDIVPVSIMVLVGQWLPEAPPVDCFGPAGFDDATEGCGIGSRAQVQFVFFWGFISVFFAGDIGAWFVVAGAKSKAIVGKTSPRA